MMPAPFRRALPVLTAVGAALVWFSLGLARRQPLSWDESVSADIAARSPHAIVATVSHTDAVLAAYYFLLHGWGVLLGWVFGGAAPTDLWWRVPSVVGALAGVALTAVVGRRIVGHDVGALAGVLLAVFPLYSFYATDARPYTLAAAAAIGAWTLWSRPGGRPFVTTAGTVVLLIVAGYLQLFTALVWPAFVLLAGPGWRRRAWLVLAVAAVGISPVAAAALRQTGQLGWIPAPSWQGTASVLARIGGGAAVAVAVGVLAVAAGRAGLIGRGRLTQAALWWTLGPAAVLVTLDLAVPVLVARYAVVSAPMLAVAVTVVVLRAVRLVGPRRTQVLALAGVVVAACLVTSAVQAARPYKYENYRAATTHLRSDGLAGVPVLFVPASTRLGWDRYATGLGLRDVASPGGVGPDPLRVVELPTGAITRAIAGQCRVLLVGNALGAPAGALPATDQAKLAVVRGWGVADVDAFGQVVATVLTNPRCRPVGSPAGSPTQLKTVGGA